MPCNVQECPVNVDIDWSGSGSSSKEVFNEINSIPDNNHLPKVFIGTTRAQSPNGDDLNNVVEGEYLHPHHTESENPIKNNIQVDDFYYDYNFIKFHEDLSYDFDKEGTGVADYSGIDLKQDAKPSPTTVYRQGADPPTATSITASTAYPPTASTSLFNEKPQNNQPDENASEDDVAFEDYFLPVVTTAMPRSSNTRFSQIWKDPGVYGSAQDLSTVESPLPTDEVPSKGLGTTLLGATSSVYGTHEPRTHARENTEDYGTVQTDNSADQVKTENVAGQEEQFGEDIPGGESDWDEQEEHHHSPRPTGLPSNTNMDTYGGPTMTPVLHETPVSTTALLLGRNAFPRSQYEDTDMSINTGTVAGENSMTLNRFSQEPLPTPYNPAENKISMTSSAGSESTPYVVSYGDLQSPSWISTELPTTIMPDVLGTNSPAVTPWPEHLEASTLQWAPPAPSPAWTEIDFNEIIIPPLLRFRSPSSPEPSQSPSQVPTSQHPDPVEPDVSSPLPSTPIAFWSSGNWSAVSNAFPQK